VNGLIELLWEAEIYADAYGNVDLRNRLRDYRYRLPLDDDATVQDRGKDDKSQHGEIPPAEHGK
jgi:hypothetical protein